MPTPKSTKAIIIALSANLTIAVIKTTAAIWTGSGSMMTEAIHSFADCGNQVLLFIGVRRAALPPSEKHPMGYGRESYVWSMLVALMLFFLGGLFSVYEGLERLAHPKSVQHTDIAIVIILMAFVLEAISLRSVMAALKEERGGMSLWAWFKASHASDLMVIIGEDIAAMVGLVIVLAAMLMVKITGNVIYDAVGSALIGMLLITVSILIVREVHSLLLGEADLVIRDDVHRLLSEHDQVVKVFNIFAIHHGDRVMVTINAELPSDMKVERATGVISGIEKMIKEKHLRVKWVFFEITPAKSSSFIAIA